MRNRSKLKNLALNITDGEHGSISDVYQSDYYLLSNKNIVNGQIIIDKNDRRISKESLQKIKRRTKLECGDLVVSSVGSIGKTAIIKHKIPNYDFQRSVAIIKLNQERLLPEYLYYYLNLDSVQKYLNNRVNGAVQKCLYIGDIKELEIDYHDIHNQKKIASVLNSIDQKIELNNRINAELEAMAKTIYDYWFVQFDFPDEKGRPYKSSGGKMVWSENLKREIPKGWEVGGFSNVGEIIGGSTPSRSEKDFFTDNGVAWITPKDLSQNVGNKYISHGEFDVTEEGMKDASLKVMPKGTVLLTSRAPIGYIAIANNEVTTNQGFKSIVPNNDFTTEYVFYLIQSYIPGMVQYASGSTFSEISASTLKMIKLPIPPTEIVAKFTDKVNSIFDKQRILEGENKTLIELRDWLLPMLMNGQIVVSK